MITPGTKLFNNIREFQGISLALDSDTSLVNERDPHDDNSTPLIAAAMVNNRNAAEILLDRGANPNLIDDEGLTALHWAAHNNNEVLIKKILTKGANINAQDNTGSTPLHWAYNLNSMDAIKILRENGASQSIKDKNGKIPSERSTAPEKTHEDQLQSSPLMNKILKSPSFRNFVKKTPSGEIVDLIELATLQRKMAKLSNNGKGFNFNLGGPTDIGTPVTNSNLTDEQCSTFEK